MAWVGKMEKPLDCGSSVLRVRVPSLAPFLKYRNGEPCNHRGCQHHISHPCEGCGRIGAEGEIWISKGYLGVGQSGCPA